MRWHVVLCWWLTACGGTELADESLEPPHVEIFGAGSISTDAPEFAIAFSPSGDTAYFNRTPADRSSLDLMVSVRSSGEWLPAVPFGPTLGIAAIDPFMTESGDELFFSSDLEGGGVGGSFNLWSVRRESDEWSEPRAMPHPVNSDSSDVFNSFASDGPMVFSSRRDGERRIYVTRETADGWSTPQLVNFGSVTDASNPAISPDGQFLVGARRVEARGADLFVSCRTSAGWGEPMFLRDPINSEFGELAPTLAGDWMYFTSERPGVVPSQPDGVRPPGDIYRTPIENVVRLCEPLAF
jgi:Tol biopolymer transport system component